MSRERAWKTPIVDSAIYDTGTLEAETVVYSEEAIVPVGLIVYTREGWEAIC